MSIIGARVWLAPGCYGSARLACREGIPDRYTGGTAYHTDPPDPPPIAWEETVDINFLYPPNNSPTVPPGTPEQSSLSWLPYYDYTSGGYGQVLFQTDTSVAGENIVYDYATEQSMFVKRQLDGIENLLQPALPATWGSAAALVPGSQLVIMPPFNHGVLPLVRYLSIEITTRGPGVGRYWAQPDMGKFGWVSSLAAAPVGSSYARVFGELQWINFTSQSFQLNYV